MELMTQPSCDCHGEPKKWSQDKRYKAGGFWYCAVRGREKARRWAERNPEKALRYNRENPWMKHHLSNDGYFALLLEQEGKCKGCGVSLREYWERRGRPEREAFFQVDHDHDCCPRSDSSCGRCIRGLLCRSCNIKDVLSWS